MKLVSLNTGLPRDVPWRGINVNTAIYKQPVAGRIALRKLIWMAIVKPTSRYMAANTRPYTATRSRITNTGKESCPTRSCRWAHLEKTSPWTSRLRIQSIWAIGSLRSVLRKSS